MSFGDRLKELRLKSGNSMEQLSKLINASSSRISDWENGKNDPSSKIVVVIAKYFKVSTDWLLTGEESIRTIEEKPIFFMQDWESTTQTDLLKSFLSKVDQLSIENVHVLDIMAERLVELSSIKHINRDVADIEKRPSQKNKGLIISDGSSQYIPSEGFVKLPLVGRIPAGDPILAHENIEEYIAVPQSLLGNSKDKHFLLLVKGSSMINVGINEGDYVIARQQNTADNGEIVVAMTNDMDATVKTFYKEVDYIRLQPENELMKPIILKEVNILAKVIAVYRVGQQ